MPYVYSIDLDVCYTFISSLLNVSLHTSILIDKCFLHVVYR